jgi:hypothetical protein
MKNIYAIIIAVSYCFINSCSMLGYYNKEKAIIKFCNKDTIQFTTTIHDTIIIDSIHVDTVFNETIDSVYLVKDKVEIRYLKRYGKVYLEGKYKGDTVFYEKKVIVEVPCNTPKLKWYKQLGADYWWVLPSLVLAYFLLLLIRKKLNNI